MTAFPIRMRRWLAALGVVAGLMTVAPAAAADFELPPVDEVFVLSAQATAPGRIELRWKIADGYYLYRHRTSASADAAFAGARLALPDGKPHRDEFFGDVETYRGSLTGVLSGAPAEDAASTTLTVKYQGCADVGVCYPPQTRTLRVALAQAGDGGGFGLGPRRGAGLFGLGGNTGKADAAPLPAEQAFSTEVIADGGNALLLRLTPAPGYYIYRDKLGVRLEAGKGLAAALPAAARMPKATPYHDEHFGDVAVYFDQVEIRVPVARNHVNPARGTLVLDLQGCQDGGICYPPMTRRLEVALPMGTLTPAALLETAAPTTEGPAPVADLPGALPGAADAADGAATPAPATATPIASVDAQRTPPPTQASRGLLASLALALLGGLILNLMPCVLPVLSLKALSLAQSGESREHARRHALAYTAGVLLSFAALGALALALRQAGLALGWGFQLQQPLVVALLALVIFALGLSLSGLWYANLGLGARSNALLQKPGVAGDFGTGVLAVVLATPCTAPFMGAALAYAFTGPAAGGMLVFLMLGLGLALPFLLIGFVPAFARLLPKPGAWMETLKQLLAFPLYATAAWLVWVLAKQRGADAVGLWLAAAVLLALAAWAWGRSRQAHRHRWLAVAVVALVATAWPLSRLHRLPKAATPVLASQVTSDAVPYSEQALADLRAQGRPVFVNMTADWCVSCKANERGVLAREEFRQALHDANAAYMVGDYTDVDPAITAYLQEHKAVGVPLHVVYPRDGGPERILPVLLTPAIVGDALREAAR